MKTLVILSHPQLDQSVANLAMIEEYKKSSLDITIHHLEATYSGYDIDVAAEQQLLLDADTIVLQFPFYWYSSPPALKNWLDKVLTYDFAYGSNGDKLKGKNLLLSISAGSPKEAYNALGYNHFNIFELLRPFEQTAYLTQMRWHEPMYVYGSMYIPNISKAKESIKHNTREHAVRVLNYLNDIVKE